MSPNSELVSESPGVLTWESHPAAYSTKRTLIVIIFLLMVFMGVYFTTDSVMLTAVAVLIMIGSLSSYFFPTRYTFGDDGIQIKTVSGKRNYNWERFRSFYPDRNGVLLSPFLRPTRLENFRGVYIRFSDNRDKVVEYLNQRLSKDTVEEEGKDVVS